MDKHAAALKHVNAHASAPTDLRASFKAGMLAIIENARALEAEHAAERKEALEHLTANLDQLFDNVVANTTTRK